MKNWFKLLFALLIFLPFLVFAWVAHGPKVEAEKNNRWTYIIVHHSASEEDSHETIDKFHREKRGWDGIGYHFVIGNGVKMKDGKLEATFRYQQKLDGAHTLTSDNFYNQKGIGICMIGNFNLRSPSEAQMEALYRLVSFLMNQYHISPDHVITHGETKATDCPGKMFPFGEFKEKVKNIYEYENTGD